MLFWTKLGPFRLLGVSQLYDINLACLGILCERVLDANQPVYGIQEGRVVRNETCIDSSPIWDIVKKNSTRL